MTLPPVALLAGLSLFAADERIVTGVHDAANLFSPDARRRADGEIAAFRDVYHFDIVIDTVAALPEGLHKKIAGMKPAQASPLLYAWADAQVDWTINNGVYVWICKEPGDVEVVVSPEAQQREFTQYDATRLRSLLKSMRAGPTHAGQRDKRLLLAVAQVREAVRYNLRPPFPWLAVGSVLVGVVGLWGILSLVRRRLGAPGATESPRLALLSGLLGGEFGTVAGHWVIDTLFVAASRSSAPVVVERQVRQPTAPSSPAATEAPAPAQSDRLDLAAREEFV